MWLVLVCTTPLVRGVGVLLFWCVQHRSCAVSVCAVVLVCTTPLVRGVMRGCFGVATPSARCRAALFSGATPP